MNLYEFTLFFFKNYRSKLLGLVVGFDLGFEFELGIRVRIMD